MLTQAVKHFQCKLKQLTSLLCCLFPNSFSEVNNIKLKKKKKREVMCHRVDTFCVDNHREKFIILTIHMQIDFPLILQSFAHTKCSKIITFCFILLVFKKYE